MMAMNPKSVITPRAISTHDFEEALTAAERIRDEARA
jgi:hypothetical protein